MSGASLYQTLRTRGDLHEESTSYASQGAATCLAALWWKARGNVQVTKSQGTLDITWMVATTKKFPTKKQSEMVIGDKEASFCMVQINIGHLGT
jgi:hypothetical protein